MHQGRFQITMLLIEFSLVVLPTILVHPLFKWIDVWVLNWRVTLVRAYLARRTDAHGRRQRVHEDTSRFARGFSRAA